MDKGMRAGKNSLVGVTECMWFPGDRCGGEHGTPELSRHTTSSLTTRLPDPDHHLRLDFEWYEARALPEASKRSKKRPKEEICCDRVNSGNGVGFNLRVLFQYDTQRRVPHIGGGSDCLEATMVSRSMRVSSTDHTFPETGNFQGNPRSPEPQTQQGSHLRT
jgi:hypothetical protein